MPNNKKIKLNAQWVIELFSLLMLITFSVLFFVFYAKADVTIVRTDGPLDIYSYVIKKTSILVLFLACVAVYVVITAVQFIPKLWKDQSIDKSALSCLKYMISTTKLIFIAVMFYICIASILASKILGWVLIIAIVATVIELAIFLTFFFKCTKNTTDKE